MRNSYTKIVALLIERRKKLAYTQLELAEKLGKPQSYVAKYEGMTRTLDVPEFIAVCKALDLRPSKVMVLVQ